MDRCLQCDGKNTYSSNYEYYKNTLEFNVTFSQELKSGKLGYCKSCKTYWYLDSEELNIYPSFEKISNVETVFSLTKNPPLLFINGQLKSEGKYLDVDECKELLLDAMKR